MQINNLQIKYSKLYQKWQVKTPAPDSRVLEEFSSATGAIKYATETLDYTQRRKK